MGRNKIMFALAILVVGQLMVLGAQIYRAGSESCEESVYDSV